MHIIFYLAREKYPKTWEVRILRIPEYLAVVAVGAATADAVVATLSLCFCVWQSYFFFGHRRRATCPRPWQLHLAGTEGGRGGFPIPNPTCPYPLPVPKAMLNPNLSRNSLPMTPERPLLNTDGGRRHRDRSGEGTSASTYIYMPSESTHDSCYGPLTTGRAILGDAKYSSVLLLY